MGLGGEGYLNFIGKLWANVPEDQVHVRFKSLVSDGPVCLKMWMFILMLD